MTTEKRRITLQLDGHQKEFIGDDYEVRQPLGLYEVWNTRTDTRVWAETSHDGIREVQSISVTP